MESNARLRNWKKNQNKQPKTNPAKLVSHDRVCHLRVTSEKAPCCNLIPWNLLGLHLHTRSEGPGILPKSLGQFHRTDWGSQSTGENLICDKKCTSRGKSRRKCLTPPWTECLYSPDVHPAWQQLGKEEQCKAFPLAQWRQWDGRKVLQGIPTGKACVFSLWEPVLSNPQTMAATCTGLIKHLPFFHVISPSSREIPYWKANPTSTPETTVRYHLCFSSSNITSLSSFPPPQKQTNWKLHPAKPRPAQDVLGVFPDSGTGISTAPHAFRKRRGIENLY